MARTVWANVTLSSDSDLAIVEPNVSSFGVGSLANKHTLAKNEIGRILRLKLGEYKQTMEYLEEGTDGSVTASGTTFTSLGSTFTTNKVTTSSRLWITSGDDVGVYTFGAVTATTLTTCSPAFTTTAGSLSFYIEPDVLDLIKNPLILTPAAVFLALHYCAVELVQSVGDFWDMKKDYYRQRFQETYKELTPDLLIDSNQDDIIGQAERAAGITGGRLDR
jgi:hypothetical protein